MSRFLPIVRLVAALAARVATASPLLLVVCGSADAAIIMINDGLAPPNAANVIDDYDYCGDDVYVPHSASTLPMSGGTVGWNLLAGGIATMSGGRVSGALYAGGSYTGTITRR